MTDENKVAELERSILFDSPEELDKTCKRLGSIKHISRALGLACHFRGLEWVKVLVKNNAKFKVVSMRNYNYRYYKGSSSIQYFPAVSDFLFLLTDPKIHIKILNYQQRISNLYNISSFPNTRKQYETNSDKIIAFEKEFIAIPNEERIKCVKYFIELNNKDICDLQKLLYAAIVNCDKEVIDLLRNNKIKLSESACDMLIGVSDSDNYFFWDLSFDAKFWDEEDFIFIAEELHNELGENRQIQVSNTLLERMRGIFYKPKVFPCFLKCFDQKKLNKKKTMQDIILTDKAELLPVCEEYGWLKMPQKRDELIQFASDNGKTECTAWLLEFKNRTADLKAESEKAEKKLMSELNADPNSVTELRKIWSFEKNEKDEIIITGYKGNRSEIVIPEEIGKNTVVGIGEQAFSPKAKRIREPIREIRRAIVKITLPETIRTIGNEAFHECELLTDINLPKSIISIGEFAFFKCKALSHIDLPPNISEISKGMLNSTALEEIVIDENIKKIGSVAFYGCPRLKSVLICEGTEEIEKAAFYNCRSLETAVLPNSIIKMPAPGRFFADYPFCNCDNLMLSLRKGSYAENYCKENNIAYKICQDD